VRLARLVLRESLGKTRWCQDQLEPPERQAQPASQEQASPEQQVPQERLDQLARQGLQDQLALGSLVRRVRLERKVQPERLGSQLFRWPPATRHQARLRWPRHQG
jgi:hypothetical protein